MAATHHRKPDNVVVPPPLELTAPRTPTHAVGPDLSTVMVGVVIIAIVVITLLTVTAIWNGPPAV